MEAQINITEEKLKASEMVEVIVETEAQAGMSGISVSGGGKEGIFISDVLKDSPAAKTLPLLEGDQLLSARVFFENVRYEDALRILQCAEQYKVSFCLKRTVPSADVTVSPTSGSVEVKGPKAKMPKMTVKSLTPVKKKKKKVASQGKVPEDESVEAVKGSDVSVGNMEIPPVDVEFSFPKFSKFLKTKGTAEASAATKATDVTTKADGEQKWAKIKFPRLKVKEAAAGGVSVEAPELKAASPKGSLDNEGKEKTTSKFGIMVPKMKKTKVDATVAKPGIELSVPKLEIESKTPQVELDIPLPTGKPDTQEISTAGGIKMAVLSASAKIPELEIKVPTSHVEVELPESKLGVPQLSKVGICSPSIDKEMDVAVDGKPRAEIKLPSVEIAAPKLDVDLSSLKKEGSIEVEAPDSKGYQIKLPTFGMTARPLDSGLDISPPKVKKDIEVKAHEDKFKMPEIGISLPKVKLEGDSPDGRPKTSMKFPSLDVSAPKGDITLPKGKLDADISGEFGIPDVSLKTPKMSPPKIGMKVKDAYADSARIKGGAPQVDWKKEKIEAETSVAVPDVTIKMPKIGLPKFGGKGEEQESQAGKIEGEGQDFELRGPKMKLPSFGLLQSKEKFDTVGVSAKESELEAEGKIKFPSLKMPSLDISVPEIQPGKLEVTLPTTKTPEVEDKSDLKLKMPKVSLPKFEVSAKTEKPQVSPPKLGIHMPKIEAKEGDLAAKGDKITLPKVDISIPKMKPTELDITPPKGELDISVGKTKIALKPPKVESDAIVFYGDTGDSKLEFPSVHIPSLELDAPKFDINLPKVKTDTLTEESESLLHLPKMALPTLGNIAKDMGVEINVPMISGEVSLPQVSGQIKKPALEGMDLGDKGAKVSLPKVEIGLGKPADDHGMEVSGLELKEKFDLKLPHLKLEGPEVEGPDAKLKLPSMKLPSVAITAPKVPDMDIDVSMPKIGLDGPSKEDATVELADEGDVKWKAPKFSFRKLGISGPKFKKGGEADLKTSHAEGEAKSSVKSPKIKMPKFGITFPKSKQEYDGDVSKPTSEVKVKTKKGKAEVSTGQVDARLEGKGKLPSVKLPSVDISAPKLEVDIAVPKGDISPTVEKPSDMTIDIPDVKLNLPKFSMPKFGSRSKESDVEGAKLHSKISATKTAGASDSSSDGGSSEGKGKMKMPTIKMPSFGISRKETDVSEGKLEVSPPEVKIKKTKAAVKETKVEADVQESNGKTSFMKMPTFKMSPLKVKAPDVGVKGSKEDIQLPDVQVKVPQVELPSFGLKFDKTADVTVPHADAKVFGLSGFEQEMPSLEISVPRIKPEICIASPKAEVDVSDADIKGYEGDLKIPKLPSISVPSLELDINLPKGHLEKEADLEKSDLKLKMPKVELTKFGESDRAVDAKADMTETKMKMKMPHFDISLTKGKAGEEDLPFIERELKMHGADVETSFTEGKFSMPSVELPKMSTPKIRGPEVDLDFGHSKDELKAGESAKTRRAELTGPEVGLPDLKFKMPKMKLPQFGGSSSDVDEETTKVDAKALKTAETGDSGKIGFKIKMPKLQMGSLKGKGEDDVFVEMEGDKKKMAKDVTGGVNHNESENSRKFKIKMPSFGISKESTDTAKEPLHPTGEGGELKFTMPKISIPDVGFSGSESESGEASLQRGRAKGDINVESMIKGPKSSSLEDLEIDLGLKMPKIQMPTFGMPGRRGDDEINIFLEEDSDGKKTLFKMPDVEISTPKIKAHAEYDVDGAKLEKRWSREMEMELIATKKAKTEEESRDHSPPEEESGKKYKVKLPKFGISVPKPVPGDIELSAPKLKTREGEISTRSPGSEHETDHHDGKKSRRNIFSLGKNKDKNAALLASDTDASLDIEGPELKIKMPKIKMKPTFGKAKGSDLNGDFDASASGDTDADMSPDGKTSKIKFPKLGFSSKTNAGDVSVNGASPSGKTNGENEASAQNGSQDAVTKMGKLKFPKLEFSSPSKGKESDMESNLKLVKTEDPDSKEESHESSFASKFKSFSGFKKKDKGGEHLGRSLGRTEVSSTENFGEGEAKTGRAKISLGFLSSKSKGEYTVDNSGIEKDSEGETGKEKNKYKMPKLSLGPKSETELEVSTTQTREVVEEGSQEGFSVSLPRVGFTTHHEEHTVEEEKIAGGFLKITTTKQIKTETVTEKTLSI
ncbi:periaxin [Pelodytes ibericus]